MSSNLGDVSDSYDLWLGKLSHQSKVNSLGSSANEDQWRGLKTWKALASPLCFRLLPLFWCCKLFCIMLFGLDDVPIVDVFGLMQLMVYLNSPCWLITPANHILNMEPSVYLLLPLSFHHWAKATDWGHHLESSSFFFQAAPFSSLGASWAGCPQPLSTGSFFEKPSRPQQNLASKCNTQSVWQRSN